MSQDAALWHPVALSASIEPSTSAGLRLNTRELVVWRDNAGKAHVWEDRCPHRGMKLSFGFVRGDHLACLYHGWQYDTAGQCRYIPAHPDLEVPATIKVPVLATREWGGIIWTTEDSGTHEADNPAFPTAPVRSLYLDLGIAAARSLLLDANIVAHDSDEYSKGSALADNLISLQAGADRLLVALQPVSEHRTGLHVVIAGIADAAKQKHYAAAISGLRIKTGAFQPAIAEPA